MSIYDPSFTSAQAAKAAGMTPVNFRAHHQRGNWRIIGDSRSAEARGDAHLFSIYEVLGYALAHELVRFGVEPKVAFERAMTDFAHVGGEDRDPGGLFDPETMGETLYVYSPGATIGQCLAANRIENVLELLLPPGHCRASTAIVIVLNDLRRRVFASLGLTEADA